MYKYMCFISKKICYSTQKRLYYFQKAYKTSTQQQNPPPHRQIFTKLMMWSRKCTIWHTHHVCHSAGLVLYVLLPIPALVDLRPAHGQGKGGHEVIGAPATEKTARRKATSWRDDYLPVLSGQPCSIYRAWWHQLRFFFFLAKWRGVCIWGWWCLVGNGSPGDLSVEAVLWAGIVRSNWIRKRAFLNTLLVAVLDWW